MNVDDFLVRAWLAGIGVALLTAPLGCFVIWRRMAFFGDAMAHSALLGVAIGFLVGLHPTIGVIMVTVAVALALLGLQRRAWLSGDTLLGILSHATLSFGLVAIGLMPWLRLDLFGYLFGDILAVSPRDISLIYGGGLVVLAVLAVIWRPLLAATVHEDLARAEGVPVERVQLVFMVLIAATIALAMKVVGILLITAMLIIPAAAARRFAPSPERMAALTAVFGTLAVTFGLAASWRLDTPSGPSIVVAAVVLFMLSEVPRQRTAGA
jgi:zinc transport system permease protein